MQPSLKNYKSVHLHESWGKEALGVQVLFSGPIDISAQDAEELRYLTYRFTEEFMEGVRFYLAKKDTSVGISRSKMIIDLRGCFPVGGLEYVEVPNEYCSRACCYARPWLSVLTSKGPIKIGWRKSVINIDWSGLLPGRIKDSSIFDDQEVTHGNYFVHAWGYEKAAEYLKKILS